MDFRKRFSNLSKLLIPICLLALAGCGSKSSGPPPNPVVQQPQAGAQGPAEAPPAPAASLSGSAAAPAGPRPQFLDFPDIPIPSELDLRSKDSYVFQGGAQKSGMLTLRGRVDLNSAINFFQMALPRENWKLKGGFRYRRSVLIFEKPDKVCVIFLHEGTYYTYVEIYVAPAGGQI